mgnify:CR=1 FL=1
MQLISSRRDSTSWASTPPSKRITNNLAFVLASSSFAFDFGLSGNVQNHTWTGNLATGDSETITFDDLILCKGNYNYTLEITEYNGSIDLILCNNEDGFSFEAVNGSDLEVIVQSNFQEEETSFEIYNSDNVIIYSENNFESNELRVTLKTWIFMRGLWSMKTFVFVVSFSLSWVIGNTVLLKGVEEILRKNFHVMLNSKSYTYQSLRVKPLEISYSSVNFFSDRDEVLLVSEEFVLTEELGIRQCGLPTQWGTW